VLFATVLTHTLSLPPSKRTYCTGVWKAAAAAGVEYVVLGDETLVPLAAPYNHTVKLTALRAFLAEAAPLLPVDTLVVVHDALDVLVQGRYGSGGGGSDGSAATEGVLDCVSRVFAQRGMERSRDVLISGERDLWPPSDAYEAASYPRPSGVDYGYLNSGLMAGSVPALRELVDAALAPANNAKTC
jgi:hypothetical protein